MGKTLQGVGVNKDFLKRDTKHRENYENYQIVIYMYIYVKSYACVYMWNMLLCRKDKQCE